MAESAPISTVYVQNLEERVKPEPLTSALRTVFSTVGTVVDVVARQNLRAKGQAFVVYDDAAAAREAVAEMSGFPLFGRPMRLAIARSRSDKTVEMTGTAEELEAHKQRRLAEKEKKKAAEAAAGPKHGSKRGLAASAGAGAGAGAAGATGPDGRPVKMARASGLKSTSVAQPALIPDEYLPPNKILFLQHVPEEYDADALAAIFGRFDGFREVRLVPGRRGIAFVEYEAEQGAIQAKESTAGMTLGDKNIKVTFQRQ